MPALLLNGKELAASIQLELTTACAAIRTRLGRAPKLAVVLVGENPASKVYVASKTKAAARVGIETIDLNLPADITQQALHVELDQLNARRDLDGVLLQLPLPKGLDEFQALLRIRPDLDVDGLHPTNQGLLLRGAVAPRSCTPLGCMALIDLALKTLGKPLDLAGRNALVVGRSVLVGKPVAFLLLERNCTVTIAHSRTQDLEDQCRQADILVAALGRPQFIKKDWIKPGAIVIDVGINRLDDGTLVGDVDERGLDSVASAYSPVPGGVGPMTITMLLSNTLDSARAK